MKKEIIGKATLYLGDCLDILPTLDKVDAVVTDPPYGLKENANRVASRTKLAQTIDYGSFDWDERPATREQIDSCVSAGQECVIFGGNYFHLPPSRCWLVWDKENSGNFADAELAWTNIKGSVRLKRHMWNGMLRASERHQRVHPTQKPIVVLEWVINQFKKSPKTILDPFMGSGTTGVACMNLGREFIGIEIEPKYFEIACERIAQAQKQQRLFA
jgi:site-specific DNA-methyltransferase (adenine-specific)/modification methylase